MQHISLQLWLALARWVSQVYNIIIMEMHDIVQGDNLCRNIVHGTGYTSVSYAGTNSNTQYHTTF